jgi:hypothetical protein
MRVGQGSWQAVSRPTELIEGSEVRSRADDGSGEIRFADGSKVVLAPSTFFKVDRMDSKESVFSLGMGRIRAAFSGMISSRIKINTPTAVCSVRGTVFELGADEKGSHVAMAEGVLEVKDSKGQQAVVSSEESLRIGPEGMDRPQLIGLSDSRALEAVRPMVVSRETVNDATRSMMEEMRNRELKAGEAQLGKDVVDAFGRRVRLEEYFLRPAPNEFKLLFLTLRDNRFDWGHIVERFKYTLPDDLTQLPSIVANTYLSPTLPSNWLKYFEMYVTNTVDSVKETITLGDPMKINFSGYGSGWRYYPATMDYVQTLAGPGVPGGSREQFRLEQNYGSTFADRFTWTQRIPNAAGVLSVYARVTLDPTDPVEVADGGTVVFYDGTIDPTTTDAFPSGSTKADFQRSTVYADNS